MIRLLAILYPMLMVVGLPHPVAAHCAAGQTCEYDPWHHCPNNQPCGELKDAVIAMNNTAEAISNGDGGIIRLYKDRTELAPLGGSSVLPPLARPPGIVPAVPASGGVPKIGAAGPVAAPAPGETPTRSAPALSAQQLERIPQGVIAATRDMLSVRSENKIAIETGGPAKPELALVHAMKLGQNFEALKRYNNLMERAEHLSKTGDLTIKRSIRTDLEQVRAFTQGIVDTRERPVE